MHRTRILTAIVALTTTLLAAPSPAIAATAAGARPAASCRTVTYTPATASRAQAATLCVPQGAVGRTAVLLIHGGGGYSGRRSDLRACQQDLGSPDEGVGGGAAEGRLPRGEVAALSPGG